MTDTHASIGRRAFLAAGAGAVALGSRAPAHDRPGAPRITGGDGARGPHFAPRAKRVVWLFQSGGPAQHELFDPKPLLDARHGQELPPSVRGDQKLTTMSANQSSFPLARSVFGFARHGESGTAVSELLPHTARIVDRLCVVRSMHTDAINHDPAITLCQTGAPLSGRPSFGSWLSWALGTEDDELPGFVVLMTKGKGGQPLYARLWGSGFLPAAHQGVPFRAGREPVLFLADPPGVSRASRVALLDRLDELHVLQRERTGDVAVDARRSSHAMALRLQASVPDVADVSREPESTFRLYGDDARKPGTYAANCLLARRLLERGVRCVQLFHKGWDQHGNLPNALRTQCRETDQASAALVVDLAQRGLLDDTIVIWGGEFGRTAYCQGRLTAKNYGRDHHPRCFSSWLAGGGIAPGTTWGETDPFGYNVVGGPVHVHDLHATVLHQLGLDHERLTYRHKGRDYRLTDVAGRVVDGLLA